MKIEAIMELGCVWGLLSFFCGLVEKFRMISLGLGFSEFIRNL